MLDDIIIYVLLGAAPALLWSFPKTRRMTGAWITALKTVPVGCLAMILLPVIIGAIIDFANHRWKLFPAHGTMFGFLLIAVTLLSTAVGVWLIIYLAGFIWRKYEAVGKRSWLPFVFIFVVLSVGSGILSVALPIVQYTIQKENYQKSWSSISLPVTGNAEIAFEQCSIHPFLAEYKYRLRFKNNGKTEYRNLMINTGGKTYFNVYHLRDGRLYLTDKDGDYIVDPAKAEVQYLFRKDGKLYAAPYSQGKFNSWGPDTENSKVFLRLDKQKYEAYLLSDELDGKTYYGCITYDFYPAAEKPESPIDKRWKHNQF